MIHKILYLSHCGSSIGGGEKQLFHLITHLNRYYYEPFVICPDDGIFAEQLRKSNIPILILNLPPWRKVSSRLTRHVAAAKLTKAAKEFGTQLIHTSDSWLNPYVTEVANSLNIPTISHVRNILTPSQVSKYSFDSMDVIIAISKESKVPLVYSGIPHEKIRVILNCVDTNEFQQNQEESAKTDEPFVIGIVGRIEPFKNQMIFVEIAYRVTQRCQNVRFHIIGGTLNTHEHRRYEKAVRQLVSEYQLDDVIHFTGHITDMSSAMRDLDLLVTLSAGSVIAEAMASGKPVIGTPIGSTSDMIEDGVSGYVIPLNPLENIVQKIIEVIKDPVLCMQLGQNARKRAETMFSIDTHVQKVEKIYKQLLEDS